MNQQAVLFYIVAGLTGASAISVVVSQNIVRAAVFLLFALGGTAGIFFLLGADFVGATQLMVYVGGILVLVVFGVMLTAQGPFITMKISAAEWAVGVLVGLLLYAAIAVSLLQPNAMPQAKAEGASPEASQTSLRLGEAFLGVEGVTPESKITGVPLDRAPARTRMSYLLPFEIVSVHLLVVLIGAAYLARAKRRRAAVE